MGLYIAPFQIRLGKQIKIANSNLIDIKSILPQLKRRPTSQVSENMFLGEIYIDPVPMARQLVDRSVRLVQCW